MMCVETVSGAFICFLIMGISVLLILVQLLIEGIFSLLEDEHEKKNNLHSYGGGNFSRVHH